MTSAMRGLFGRRSSAMIGVLVLTLIAIAFVLVYQKESLKLVLSPGDTIKAQFSRDYKLVPADSDVKLAGISVGKVSDLEQGERGRSLVSMKLDDGVVDKLGSAPTAAIRPTTVLGGKYYIELTPGGARGAFDEQTIPVRRTNIPVELDEVLAAVPPPAQQGVRTTAKQLDRTLKTGGKHALQDVLRDAPSALRPAGSVLQAVRGNEPATDLNRLVTNVDALAAVLTEKDGQLGHIVDSLSGVSASLSNASQPLADTVRGLPETLSSTRSGVLSLRGTLGRLANTAGDARPAIQQLDPLLRKADPVVRQARPVVNGLRPLLHELNPAVDELVPTADRGTQTLNNINGPVLDRVKGPITKTILSPWRGKGFYAGNGSDNPFYKEVGYLGAGAANLSKYADNNGALIALALGLGTSTPGGTDLTTEKLMSAIGLLPPDGAGSVAAPFPPKPGSRQLLPGTDGPLGRLQLPDGLPPVLGNEAGK